MCFLEIAGCLSNRILVAPACVPNKQSVDCLMKVLCFIFSFSYVFAGTSVYVIFGPLTLTYPHDQQIQRERERERRASEGAELGKTHRQAEIDVAACELLMHCWYPVCCHETNEC